MTKNFSYIGEINNFEGKKVNSLEELYSYNVPMMDQEAETTLLSPIVWLKAETINQLHRTRVPVWSDSSGNNKHFYQPSAGNQPYYIKNALNGYDVVRFNENSNAAFQSLDLVDTTEDFTSTNDVTIYIVMKIINSPNTWNFVISHLPNLSSSTIQNWDFVVRQDMRIYSRMSSSTIYSQNTNKSYGSFNIYKIQNSPRHSITENTFDIALYPSSNISYTTGTPNQGIRIGKDKGTGKQNCCGLDIAEILIFNYALNLEQINIVDNYLHSKYQIPKLIYNLDNMENYDSDQIDNFDLGNGFLDKWTIKENFYSLSGYDPIEYTDINQPLDDDPMDAFNGPWIIKPSYYSLLGIDTFESYLSTSNMNGGLGFDDKWIFKDYALGLFGNEDFYSYETTDSMNEGVGYLDSWKINKNPYGLVGYETFETYSSVEEMNEDNGFDDEWLLEEGIFGAQGRDAFGNYLDINEMNATPKGFNGLWTIESNTFGAQGRETFGNYLNVSNMDSTSKGFNGLWVVE